MHKMLEVIVSTVDDARQAEEGGADRLEVISHFDQDGLTPPQDLVEAMLAAVRIPLRVMVRPEDVFSVADAGARQRLLADARRCAGLPIDGIVTGYLTGEGAVDTDLLAEVHDAAGHHVTFHRAIERVRHGDAVRALRDARGVDRIRSGGGPGTWPDRVARLEQLQREASPIVVIAGGGVDDEGLALLAASGVVREVHIGRLARRDGLVDGPVRADLVRRIRLTIARAESAAPPPDPSAAPPR
jgi:copper homeostasis protein